MDESYETQLLEKYKKNIKGAFGFRHPSLRLNVVHYVLSREQRREKSHGERPRSSQMLHRAPD